MIRSRARAKRKARATRHANPVKRKLALHPKDWPWSSWSYYEKGEGGLIAIDSAGEQQRKTNGAAKRKSQTPHP
jgi:hypothetical protein